MNLNLNLGQWIVIGLSAVMVIWYIGANSANRNLGMSIYRWLVSSLEPIGKISSVEWFDSPGSGGKLVVSQPMRSFRKVEIIYLLERREFLPYWIVSHLQGKRDEVRILMDLRIAPKSHLEVVPGSPLGSIQPTQDDLHSPSKHQTAHAGFAINYEDNESDRLLERLKVFLDAYEQTVVRIRLQPKNPHLVIIARVKPLLRIEPKSYLSSVRDWFQES